MEFHTTDTTPGQAEDGKFFYWTGKGLGWDIFRTTQPGTPGQSAMCSGCAKQATTQPARRRAQRQFRPTTTSGAPITINPLETNPVGAVGSGRAGHSISIPLVVTKRALVTKRHAPNMGPDCGETIRADPRPPTSPGVASQNPPGESGNRVHVGTSHNEARDHQPNDVFPGRDVDDDAGRFLRPGTIDETL